MQSFRANEGQASYTCSRVKSIKRICQEGSEVHYLDSPQNSDYFCSVSSIAALAQLQVSGTVEFQYSELEDRDFGHWRFPEEHAI